MSKLAVILSLLFLAGCGTHRMAGLEDYSAGETAMLVMPYPVMYSGIFVTHIDCISRGWGSYKRYELIPGWRVITFSGNRGMYVPANPKNYVFKVEAGGVYTFERNYQHASNDWIIDILDQNTGEPILSQWHRTDYSPTSWAEPDHELCSSIAEMNE